jgi:hypothetical protein
MKKSFIDLARSEDRMIAFGVWFTAMCFWWLLINMSHLENTWQNFAFGFVFGLIPLFGAIIGLLNAREWGGFGSVIGRAVTLLSLGLLSWSCGSLIWAYYNFFGAVEVPYPSWADVAYVVSWPLWAWGAIELSHATGAKFSLRKRAGKLALLVITAFVIVASYYALVVVARGGELIAGDGGIMKTFFDLAYPTGDVVILSLSLVIFGLSWKYFGGQYQTQILCLLAGFVLNYFADFAFSWTTLTGTFFVGSWVDLLFMSAMTALSLGVIGLSPKISLDTE